MSVTEIMETGLRDVCIPHQVCEATSEGVGIDGLSRRSATN